MTVCVFTKVLFGSGHLNYLVSFNKMIKMCCALYCIFRVLGEKIVKLKIIK